MKFKSIVQREEYSGYCFICGTPATETHHCDEGTANRKISTDEKLVVRLCMNCHNSSKNSVHQNGKLQSLMHIVGQYAWMFKWISERYELPFGDIQEEAIRAYRLKFGKSYI